MHNKLYSLSALFKNADEIMNAAAKVAGKGFKKWDVHTPYPVHGMDDAMGLKPSKLGYFTITIGFTCMLLMLFFMWWAFNVDYPQVIGGKPQFPLPAFIPILFEITVLTGAVLTVKIMVVFFFKFPNNSHPLHDSEYMKKVSSDHFGVTIEADDENFNEEEIRALYNELGASSVQEIYWDEEEVTHKNTLVDKKFIGGLVALAIFVSVSAYGHLNKLLYLPPFDWMMVQNKVSAQQSSDFFEDGFAMRNPVEGSIARGYMPYMYKGQPEEAGKFMINTTEATEENLELGKQKWLTYCSPCHGDLGDGASRLKGQFPVGPTVHSKKVKEFSDGRIYHIIVDGQNVMPSYEKQLNLDERWAIVNYVRVMQRALDAKEADLK